MEIGGTKATNLTLRHPAKQKDDIFFRVWETDACYVKVAKRRTMLRQIYLAFDEKSEETRCVSSREEDGKKSISLKLQLHRIRDETSNRETIYRAPPNFDVGDEDDDLEWETYEDYIEDFDEEFDRISDSD